jgi:general secretion pathway protein M
MTRLPPAVRRLAALLLLLVLGPAIAWIGVGAPLVDLWVSHGDAAGEAFERVKRLRALAQRQPELERQVHAMQAALAEPGLLWPEASPPLISAAIQTRVRQAITAAGGSVRSTTEMPVVAEHGLLRIGVRVDAGGTIETLQQVLFNIEILSPVLIVDDLLVTASEGAMDAAHPPVLAITLDLTGYGRSP